MALDIRVKDFLWVRRAFAIDAAQLTRVDIVRRFMSTANYKIVDSTMGGNFTINPAPMFTPYADLKVGGRPGLIYSQGQGRYMLNGEDLRRLGGAMDGLDSTQSAPRTTSPSRGIGRYYSEAIDDNAQTLVMRFGVPEFNNMTTFFSNFFDTRSSRVGRTGRVESLFFETAKLLGQALALPLLPAIVGGRVYRYFSNSPASKFYYLKPTMFLYWRAAGTILNGISVNMGITNQYLTAAQQSVTSKGGTRNSQEMTGGDESAILQEYLRDESANAQGGRGYKIDGMFRTGGINILEVATRAQRLHSLYNEKMELALEGVADSASTTKAPGSVVIEQVRLAMARVWTDGDFNNDRNAEMPAPSRSGTDTYLEAYARLMAPGGGGKQTTEDPPQQIDENGNPIETMSQEERQQLSDMDADSFETANIDPSLGGRSGYDIDSSGMGRVGEIFQAARNYGEFLTAELREGSMYVTFAVDYSGTAQETFSSQAGETGIAQKINSTSSAARMARIDFADGNIFSRMNPIQMAIDAAKGTVSGVMTGLQLSGLMALGGSAFVDIPNVWQSSSAQLPRMDYTIKLRSPYGNKFSRLKNLFLPLSLLLAGALPISAGRAAYGSPFICEAYCRGRGLIRLGMIESMTITRGTGNVGWTEDGEPLGIDVSFQIVDLSSVVHMPISANFTTMSEAVTHFSAGVGRAIGGRDGAETGASGALNVIGALGNFSEDSTFTDYMGVLGSLSFVDMLYAFRRWRLDKARLMQEWRTQASPANMAMVTTGPGMLGLPGRVLQALWVDTDRTN